MGRATSGIGGLRITRQVGDGVGCDVRGDFDHGSAIGSCRLPDGP